MDKNEISIEDFKEITKRALTQIDKLLTTQNEAIKMLMFQCLELQKTQLEMAQSDLKNSELTEMTNKRINDLIKWLKTYRPFTSDEYAEFQANNDLDKI